MEIKMAKRIIDLTLPIHEGMATFPSYWHPRVELIQLGSLDHENRETRRLVIGTHTGTHCDAPKHFLAGGSSVDSLPLDILIGPALVIDLSDSLPGREIGVADIKMKLGDRRPERVVFRFDWSTRWGEQSYYTDYPFFSVDAGIWLSEKGVKLIGLDTPSPDNPVHCRGNVPDSPVHKIMLRSGIILVEYLCNLQALQIPEIELIVLPLKILGGDGSPARCVAIERYNVEGD
jgi:arylformamidase